MDYPAGHHDPTLLGIPLEVRRIIYKHVFSEASISLDLESVYLDTLSTIEREATMKKDAAIRIRRRARIYSAQDYIRDLRNQIHPVNYLSDPEPNIPTKASFTGRPAD